MEKFITVKTSFEGLHHWPQCPIEEVSYLKNLHRHVFNVGVKVRIKENDREIEFIQFKHFFENLVKNLFPVTDEVDSYKICNLGSMSCEMIAERICINLRFYKYKVGCITVDEDGENGVEFTFDEGEV